MGISFEPEMFPGEGGMGVVAVEVFDMAIPFECQDVSGQAVKEPVGVAFRPLTALSAGRIDMLSAHPRRNP